MTSDQLSPHHQNRWHLLCVTLLAAATFANTLGMQFASDDTVTILFNPLLHDLSLLPQLFTSGMWPAGSAPEITYRPFFMTNLALDYAIWKGNPFGYHLMSVCWHVAASVMVYLLGTRLLSSQTGGFFSAALFAVHPVHSEAVSWIATRSSIMVAFFFCCCLLLHLHYRDNRKLTLLASSIFLYALATLTKETAITFPAIIFIYELLDDERTPKRVIMGTLPYALVALAYLCVRTQVLGVFHTDTLPFLQRLYTGPGILVEYLRLLIFPYPLKVFYAREILTTFMQPGVIIPLLILIGLAAGTLYTYRRHRIIFFGAAWIFIILSPFFGILMFPRPALMAERYLYIPSFGLCLILGYIFMRVTSPSRVKWALAALLLVTLSFYTALQNRVWQNDASYYAAFVEAAPQTPQAHNGLAVSLLQAGKLTEAQRSFLKALELAPGYVDAQYNLGALYLQQYQLPLAKKQFETTLRLNPGFADAWHQLGRIQVIEGNPKAAELSFRSALAISPNHAQYRTDLAKLTRSLKER